ncbi:MAG: hypothetical protein HQK84_12365 [Nitrospinae bacterium]|nr:hypothetical protein [Nitrospinota bacterium]
MKKAAIILVSSFLICLFYNKGFATGGKDVAVLFTQDTRNSGINRQHQAVMAIIHQISSSLIEAEFEIYDSMFVDEIYSTMDKEITLDDTTVIKIANKHKVDIVVIVRLEYGFDEEKARGVQFITPRLSLKAYRASSKAVIASDSGEKKFPTYLNLSESDRITVLTETATRVLNGFLERFVDTLKVKSITM